MKNRKVKLRELQIKGDLLDVVSPNRGHARHMEELKLGMDDDDMSTDDDDEYKYCYDKDYGYDIDERRPRRPKDHIPTVKNEAMMKLALANIDRAMTTLMRSLKDPLADEFGEHLFVRFPSFPRDVHKLVRSSEEWYDVKFGPRDPLKESFLPPPSR